MGTTGSAPTVWKKPEYTRYTLDKAPNLEKLQAQLKTEGLHDPWLRNHVWKFMGPHKQLGIKHIVQAPYHGMFRGVKYGVIVVAAYIAIDKLLVDHSADSEHH